MTGKTTTRPYGTSYTHPFTYDNGVGGGSGNLTAFKGAANAFNADNQITNTGYGYDGNGNPTAYSGQVLTYDPENRLTSYGSLQTDGYDGNGLRAWKQAGSTRTYFLYDGSDPVCEFTGTGSLAAANTFGATGLLSRRSAATGASTFYSFDERGNVAERCNSGAKMQSADAYDAFGPRTSTASVQPDPFGFGGQAGYYTDVETGLILCTHRFYDPARYNG